MNQNKYLHKISEIVDITKTAIMLTLEESYSMLPSDLDKSLKTKLYILSINSVFLENTDPTKNNIAETHSELVNKYLGSIMKFILDECGLFLNNVVRLKAFAISKGVSEKKGNEYLQSIKKFMPVIDKIPTENEVNELICKWSDIEKDIIKGT